MSGNNIVPTRPLGSFGLRSPAQIIGCLGLNQVEDGVAKIIKEGQPLGLNFLDTSDIYGPFKNEESIGKATKGKKVLVSSKFGIVKDKDGSFKVDASAAYTKKACDASLKRLKTQSLELYYLHR